MCCVHIVQPIGYYWSQNVLYDNQLMYTQLAIKVPSEKKTL